MCNKLSRDELAFQPSAQALTRKTKNFGYDFLTKTSPKNFSPFYFASPEIIVVKIYYRQTNSLTPCTGLCGFFSLRSQGDKKKTTSTK